MLLSFGHSQAGSGRLAQRARDMAAMPYVDKTSAQRPRSRTPRRGMLEPFASPGGSACADLRLPNDCGAQQRTPRTTSPKITTSARAGSPEPPRQAPRASSTRHHPKESPTLLRQCWAVLGETVLSSSQQTSTDGDTILVVRSKRLPRLSLDLATAEKVALIVSQLILHLATADRSAAGSWHSPAATSTRASSPQSTIVQRSASC